MAVQSQDVAFMQDHLALLRTISGRVAEDSAGALESLLATNPPPRQGEAKTSKEYAQFEESCLRLRTETLGKLQRINRSVGFLDCAAAAFLVGQLNLGSFSLDGSPNAFESEIEFLSTYLQAPLRLRPRTTKVRGRGTIEALRLARRVRALDQFIIGNSIRSQDFPDGDALRRAPGYHGSLATQTLSTYGFFTPYYDHQYVEDLAEQMRFVDSSIEKMRSLDLLAEVFMNHLSRRLANFEREASGRPLMRLMRSRRLESEIGLGDEDYRILGRHLAGVRITENEVMESVAAAEKGGVRRWIETLTVGVDQLGRNTEGRSFSERIFRARPIVRDHLSLQFVSLHRVATDLSILLHDHWSRRYGKAYFTARSRTLERIALRTISSALPGSVSIANALYKVDEIRDRVEVDGVVIWKDVCFIVESKSGLLSTAARNGLDDAATNDLRDTIGDAFYQACRLIRTTLTNGRVELQNDQNESLLLSSRKIRRFYVVIPTAEYFGSLTTTAHRLWANEIVPDQALPLVISAQDLMLSVEFLPTPLEFIAYLDYREEILHDQRVRVADELEILGSFVGQIDLIGEISLRFREHGRARQTDSPEMNELAFIGTTKQEEHLTPWLRERAVAAYEGNDPPPPPRRHSDKARSEIEKMFERRRDLSAASISLQADPSAITFIEQQDARQGAKEIRFMEGATTALVGYPRRRDLAEVRRAKSAQEFRGRNRILLYASYNGKNYTLSHAELGRLHSFYRDGSADLYDRSRLGELDQWYEKFAKKRNPRTDASQAAALRSEGLGEDLAVGLARTETIDYFHGLTSLGIKPEKAANFVLGPGRRAAEAELKGAAGHGLSPKKAAEIISLSDAGRVESSAIGPLITGLTDRPDQTAEEVAADLELLKVNTPALVNGAIDAVLQELRVDLPLSNQSARGRMINYLIGETKRRYPRLDAREIRAELQRRQLS